MARFSRISRRRRRAGSPLLAAALCAFALDAIPAHAADLTLAQALAYVEQRAAAVRGACATSLAAEGELRDTQGLLWNNPELAVEHRRRELAQPGGPDVPRSDNGIGISQKLELGGQQGARRGAARASREAVAWTIADARREARAEAAKRYVEVLAAQERVGIEEAALALVKQGASLVQRRLAAGEETRLDANLAGVEAEHAANELAKAREGVAQARTALATLLQLDRGDVEHVAGSLDAPPAHYTLEQLLETADRRPKLRALAAKAQSARHRLDLERAARYPDLTVGLSYGPERSIEGEDRITTLSASLPLPLFRDNAGGIGRALMHLDQADIELRSARRASHDAVEALWQRARSLEQRADRLRENVLPRLAENQALSLKALRAGEIGLAQFLLVRRQLLDSRLELLEARSELRLARNALENEAGWPEALPPFQCPSERLP